MAIIKTNFLFMNSNVWWSTTCVYFCFYTNKMFEFMTKYPIIHLYIPLLFMFSVFHESFVCMCVGVACSVFPFFLFYIYFPDSLTMTQQNLPPPPVKWQTRLSRMDWRRLHVSEQTDDALAYSISRVEPRGSSKLLEDGMSLRGFLNNNFRLDIMSFT